MNQTQDLKDALFEAAKSGDLNQVRQLVESGADVNAVDGHHITPFLWAYFDGHIDVVKYLLSKGGNVNHDDFSEGTLLTLAAFTGDVAFIPYLLDAGQRLTTPCRAAVRQRCIMRRITIKLMLSGCSSNTVPMSIIELNTTVPLN